MRVAEGKICCGKALINDMDVLSLYFRFVEALSGHHSWGHKTGKINESEALLALRKIIAATNDFTAKYLRDEDLIQYGLMHELQGFCEYISTTYEELLAVFSQSGNYQKISDLFDAQVYFAVTNLLWHAIEEDVRLVLLNVDTQKNQLIISIETDKPCYDDIRRSEDVTVNLAMDFIEKIGGAVNTKPLKDGVVTFQLVLLVNFNQVGFA